MAAKRSPALPPPPIDWDSAPRRQPALELRVRIPSDLVERLDRLALQDNRDRRRQAEWLLWDAIRGALLADEEGRKAPSADTVAGERPVPYTVVPTDMEDPTP